ncbi:hypothetical protein [Tenacibaculum maritimum]|uniref:hypothetical protein n=1 Tax=Tenacibaculum maritimum TaxID=107401 RepID=UPI0012E4A877|nr:hypothetical protein [Tenacibaculum maritimum]CAA0226295.1 conserved hypothetical protein [Tenacibaculum maritimum]
MRIYKTNRIVKVLSVYLALNIIFPQTIIYNSFALTGGPSQPEFNSFTPIGTSDMVNLSSGDFNYNIPIMDVGGYPLNLSYNSGVTMDQEASWVGLGWNLNVGQIKRNVRGLPDDFDGDQLIYENNFKPNWTVGSHFGIGGSVYGMKELLGANVGLGVKYNNYNGFTVSPSIGVSFKLGNSAKVGLNISGSVEDGPTVSPSISLNKKVKSTYMKEVEGSLGMSINSRKALSSLNMSASLTPKKNDNYRGSSFGGAFKLNDSFLFTPTKRVSTTSDNFTFSASFGGTAFGISGQIKVTGYGYVQQMSDDERYKEVKAFGYENTENNEGVYDGILDFNREKEGDFTKNSTLLPLTNYTYDTYAINGQGISGGFRPYRSQIGYLNTPTVADFGKGANIGVEVEGGWVFAGGVDIKISSTYARTGLWSKTNRNHTLENFSVSKNNKLDYEKVYFRNTGELNVDVENEEEGLFKRRLGGESPISLGITGTKYARNLISQYNSKDKKSLPFNNAIKRENRLLRNQSIQKITVDEAKSFDSSFFRINNNARNKGKHTAGFNILKTDGSRYVYGQTAYNITKQEATFAVRRGKGNCVTGLVNYSNKENSSRNDSGIDGFFNRITTPAYAHSYLLTSVLSSDYEDRTGDGPTDDDFGSYTKFNYPKEGYTYKWRIPYQKKSGTFNRGLYSHSDDQKGSYIYGEREQIYIESIETKSHIAIFELSDRKDGFGVINRDGGRGTVTSKKIDKIKLYSKREYLEDKGKAVPIKTAHFVYDYSQCKGISNNDNSEKLTANELLNQGGKLTLKKVFFTYQNSKMGAYMPYEFNYGEIDSDGDGVYDKISNPDYDIKGYDIWSNYKKNLGTCDINADAPTNSEFPYTLQNSQEEANANSIAWTLTSMKLPSGGDMNVYYESDDYQYVQNKEVMQLFEVLGVGQYKTHKVAPSGKEEYIYNTKLYDDYDYKYLYVKIPRNSDFTKEDYIKNLEKEPIYFKFLTSMTDNSNQYDFVSGYLNLDEHRLNDITIENTEKETYLSLPMKFVSLDGKSGDGKINPISKAGMYFGRKNMNRIVYSRGGNYDVKNIKGIVEEIVGSIASMVDIGKGPNKVLRTKKCANRFKSKKSWIRLLNPSKRKFGGGLRVKKLQMGDNWDIMTGNNENPLYKKFYGQIYSYTNEDGTTSGVATFEPRGSRENPLVQPFYGKDPSGADKILSPKESNYIEKPIGESFYPTPSITYGRVTVSSLPHENISKHATGKVVSTFYTSYDFPTIATYTELNDVNMRYDKASPLSNFLNFSVKNYVTATQGFSIQQNDMNGKEKGKWVYAENQEVPISGVEYKYDINDNGELNNRVRTINEEGKIRERLVGVNYDVINDFRENYSLATTAGVNTNLAGFFAWIFPILVPLYLPNYEQHENVLRTAVTTKVIQKNGLLKEKIAYDLGARVSTKNLAWDANTGEVLVKETINEFEEPYYSINYPAYWKYKGMGAASKNIGLEGVLIYASEGSFTGEAVPFLKEGDELLANYVKIKKRGGSLGIIPIIVKEKLWVLSKNNNNVLVINSKGEIINNTDCAEQPISKIKFKVLRSGYRNIQRASMANITTKINPIVDDNDLYRHNLPSFYNVSPEKARIINANAVEYSDFWKPVNQEGNKYFVTDNNLYQNNSPMGDGKKVINEDNLVKIYKKYNINPYIYNIRGDWRAKRSWAYLTGRSRSANISTRNDGYFTSFTPFYKYENNEWTINKKAIDRYSGTRWTFASEVTQYTPYGVELENKDALNRYSSAQYGYKYTLPTAVASNTKYQEIGFDGFEDYEEDNPKSRNSHFSFSDVYKKDIYKSITTNEAHTGRKSIEVKPSQKFSLIKNLIDVNPKEVKDCGEGEASLLQIRNVVETKEDCLLKVRFTLVGKPNETVSYIVNGITNTVTLDKRGRAVLTHSKEATLKYICDTDSVDPLTNAGSSEIIITDENGNVLLRSTKAFVCGDCEQDVREVQISNMTGLIADCSLGDKRKIEIQGEPNQQVKYHLNVDYIVQNSHGAFLTANSETIFIGKGGAIGDRVITLDEKGKGFIIVELCPRPCLNERDLNEVRVSLTLYKNDASNLSNKKVSLSAKMPCGR